MNPLRSVSRRLVRDVDPLRFAIGILALIIIAFFPFVNDQLSAVLGLSLSGKVNEGTWKMLQQPIVWLGPKVDTSAGGQVWVPRRAEPRKGPVKDDDNRPLTGLGSEPDPGDPRLHSDHPRSLLPVELLGRHAP